MCLHAYNSYKFSSTRNILFDFLSIVELHDWNNFLHILLIKASIYSSRH